MDSTEAQYPFMSSNTKIIHFVRHAQASHNIASQKDHSLLKSPEYFDAPLSSLGFEQVKAQKDSILESGLLNRIELVITSPLSRAMRTAVGIFGSEKSGPPIVAAELCRERLGVHPCDRRSNIGEYQSVFPEIDFSFIESEEDILWKPDVRETGEQIGVRGLEFINWLWTREEREIAVATHTRFLQYTSIELANDSHPSLTDEICRLYKNCELRTLVMVDGRVEKVIPQLSEYPTLPY